MENEWKNLRFHLTEEMNNMIIELLVTEQMMKENKLYLLTYKPYLLRVTTRNNLC